jgi:hypothetical protein
MKKVLIGITLITMTLTGLSQSDTNGTTSVQQFVNNVWNFAVGQGETNLSIWVGGNYSMSAKKWGADLMLFRNVPIGKGIGIAPGLGVEYFNNDAYAMNGSATLNASVSPFTSFTGTSTNAVAKFLNDITAHPYGRVAIGTPISGLSTPTTNPETIQAGGVMVDIYHVLGGEFSLSGEYGTRQGVGQFSGPFFGGFANLHWSF